MSTVVWWWPSLVCLYGAFPNNASKNALLDLDRRKSFIAGQVGPAVCTCWCRCRCTGVNARRAKEANRFVCVAFGKGSARGWMARKMTDGRSRAVTMARQFADGCFDCRCVTACGLSWSRCRCGLGHWQRVRVSQGAERSAFRRQLSLWFSCVQDKAARPNKKTIWLRQRGRYDTASSRRCEIGCARLRTERVSCGRGALAIWPWI